MKALYLVLLVFLVTRRAEGRRSFFFHRQSSSTTLDDPYIVLGVGRHASKEEIKTAYRTKAKEWHPDKNRGDSELAAEKFRRIASAYETLSDPVRKRQYDDQWRREELHKQKQDQQRRQHRESEHRNRMQREKEAASKRAMFRPKARKLQDERVIRITTLEELEQVAFDATNTFKTNVLIVFVPNKKVEKFVDDELLFPFIANMEGMPEKHLLLPLKVRYNRDTDLTRIFQVPHYAKRSTTNAFIILGKKGQNPSLFQTRQPRLLSYTAAPGAGDSHAQFESWVTHQLSVPVKVFNHHHSNVILFQKTKVASIQESIEQRFVIKPNWGQQFNFRLGDTLLAMDSNVDRWPGQQKPRLDMAQLLKAQETVMLGQWRPWHDDGASSNQNDGDNAGLPIMEIHIHSKRCVDRSIYCGDWMKEQTKPSCGDQPEFFHFMCAKSCGICHDSKYYLFPPLFYYGLLHEPLSYWPEWSQGVIRFVRVFSKDVDHVWKFRKNAGLVFFLGGILLGWMLDISAATIRSHHNDSRIRMIMVTTHTLIDWPTILVGLLTLVYHKVLDGRHPFVQDIAHVIDYRKNVMAVLVSIGFVVALLVVLSRRRYYENVVKRKEGTSAASDDCNARNDETPNEKLKTN